MIKNYYHVVRTTVLKSSVLMALTLLIGSAMAQLSGSYTIQPGGTASSTVYTSLVSFVSDLNSKGVSGPVTATYASSGSMTESITTNVLIGTISGASSTNTITIDGNGWKLTSTVANNMTGSTTANNAEVIRFTGTDYVTIKNLTIENSNTSTNGRIIRFEADPNNTSNSADYNVIEKCTLQFSARSSSSTSAGAYIVFGTSVSATISTVSYNLGRFNKIEANLMRTTNSNSPGPAFGICDNQSTSSYTTTATANEFKNNIIENFYYYGIYLRYTSGEVVEGNDISRANTTSNNGYSYLYGIYSFYGYSSTSGPAKIVNNKIHDLPSKGVSATAATNYIYGIYTSYMVGNASYRAVVASNIIENNKAYYYFYGTYHNRCNVFTAEKNSISYNECYLYYMYAMYSNYDTDTKILSNTIVGNNHSGYYFYGIYSYYDFGTIWNECSDNNISYNKCNGSSGYGLYGIYVASYTTTGDNWLIERNKIVENEMLGYTYSYFYGIYAYYYVAAEINSNLISYNRPNYVQMCIYFYTPSAGYSKNIYQNTIYQDNIKAGYSYRDLNGVYGGVYGGTTKINGNIIISLNSYSQSPMYIYGQATGLEIDHNSYWDSNCTDNYWYNPSGSGSNFGGWMSTGLPGKGEKFHRPEFVDLANGDYRSNSFETQNNVPEYSSVKDDIKKAKRNQIKRDRGAVENFMDLKVEASSASNLPAQICAGYTMNADLRIKNLFVDTAYDFEIAYSINGSKPVSTMVSQKILSGDTATVKFSTPIQFNTVGNTSLKVFLQLPDDNTSNDTLTFTTFVKPAPGGSVLDFSTKPTATLYQRGRSNDITIVNEKVIYNFSAPRAYSNGDYGTKWTASGYAVTENGRTLPSTSVSVASPLGTSDLELTFMTSDSTLEDTMVTIYLKVSDLTNGCDTVLNRRVLIYPSVKLAMSIPSKICDGTAILFENKSNIKSGGISFFWDFGTGVAADTSNAPEPVFQYPTSGSYKVTLTGYTYPYNFKFSKVYTVNVSAIPTVSITKNNACFGDLINLTATTTPSSGVNSTWDFGDGKTGVGTSVSHKYAKAGQYEVVLRSDLNGCVAEINQKVYQFETPIADFDLISGICDNDMFTFKNKSSISGGLIGSYWDFDDNGSVSTDENPKYQFTKSGKRKVSVIVTSEFGCDDTLMKEVEVRESPKVSFTHTPACSITPTEFVNTTNDVSGTVANYNWNMGDGTIKSSKDYTHTWSSLGPKTVTLTVKLNNGCENKITKELNVLTQPKAAFAAADVCAGDPVIFVNNTTWPDGKISYVWDFGDGTFSGSSDPSKNYNVKQTTTYNVTLVASIQGGCADSITQRVIINEAPRTCDFTVEPDYAFSFHGIKVNPLNISGAPGGQANVNYTWVFAGVGTEYSANTNAAVSKDMGSDGEYTITMRAVVAQTGCECSMTKKFVLNRAGMEELAKVGVTVYPNPTAGDIKVMVSETFGTGVVRVKSMSGAELKVMNLNGNLLEVNAGDLSNGVYLVEVSNGKQVVTKKITVQK
jgi:PKD repeat protein